MADYETAYTAAAKVVAKRVKTDNGQEVEDIFDYQYKLNKPAPEIFELLLKKYPEIDPSHTLYIDDLAWNCERGQEFGFITLNLPHNGVIADFIEIREE